LQGSHGYAKQLREPGLGQAGFLARLAHVGHVDDPAMFASLDFT
jgi:hypothetical protein